jgi:DNA-binding NarL/FixJ family response regulator
VSDELLHYGILRKSGRYPWGSGKDEYARSLQFYQTVDSMKAQGLSQVEIAKAVGLSVQDLRSTTTIAKEQIVLEETRRAVALRDKGTAIQAIADQMGIPAPTVRLRLKNSENMKESSLRKTAEIIRKNVDEHEIVDIGKGVEHHLGIADTKLKSAVAVLRDEGYNTYNLQVKLPGTNHLINHKVIVGPDVTFGQAKKMVDKIHTMGEWTEDDGLTYFGIHPPISVNSSRVDVKFNSDQDGIVYVRPGVADLDMGKNTYAQARIAVDGTHFIKGVAVLNPDLPPGVDLEVHSSKSPSVGKMGALKPMKADSDNPFGSQIKRQIVTIDPKTGKEKVKSAINIVNEEGDWEDWRKSVPSQMLAKQPHSLIKSQLAETRAQVQSRLDEINKITNPVVRKKELESFADQIDSDAVDLRAAAFPRQRTQVIIPMPKMAKNEIYAPNFETGERVVLIRYPHGGRFEIPEVTVNNNNRTAKRLLGNATDAIGIHPSVAERLSGADFDGDTVIVIPNRAGKIKGSQSMGSAAKVYEEGLNNFDPKRKYGGFEQTGVDSKGRPVGNFKLMTNTGLEMGMITNLITDMQIQGAKPEHVVRAVRHSMVVIDAEKHKLDYKQSEIDNGIKQLKTLYQGRPDAGATTLLSKATAEIRVPERKLRSAAKGGAIDKETGVLQFEETGRTRNKYDPKTQTYTDQKVPVTSKIKRLADTQDAFSLVRDKNDPVEKLYAEHANAMKAMANAARLKSDRTPNPPINPKAREIYKAEVDDLVSQLRAAQKQKPLDRKAQIAAGVVVKAKRQEDPTLRVDQDRLKKVERQALAAARARLGLERPTIEISDRQWDAIQAGAVSSSRLRDILGYVDPKRVAELSMPRTNTVMTTAITSRAKSMLAAGATTADVAAALGISVSTLKAAQQRGDV